MQHSLFRLGWYIFILGPILLFSTQTKSNTYSFKLENFNLDYLEDSGALEFDRVKIITPKIEVNLDHAQGRIEGSENHLSIFLGHNKFKILKDNFLQQLNILQVNQGSISYLPKNGLTATSLAFDY